MYKTDNSDSSHKTIRYHRLNYLEQKTHRKKNKNHCISTMNI